MKNGREQGERSKMSKGSGSGSMDPPNRASMLSRERLVWVNVMTDL